MLTAAETAVPRLCRLTASTHRNARVVLPLPQAVCSQTTAWLAISRSGRHDRSHSSAFSTLASRHQHHGGRYYSLRQRQSTDNSQTEHRFRTTGAEHRGLVHEKDLHLHAGLHQRAVSGARAITSEDGRARPSWNGVSPLSRRLIVAPPSTRNYGHLQRAYSTDTANPSESLRFQMSSDDLDAAMTTSRSSSGAFWSHALYKGPRGEHVRIYYCRDLERAERAAQAFLGCEVLGIDLEWESGATAINGIKDHCSVIQIAAEDKIAIFQIAAFAGKCAAELIPPTLKAMLEDKQIIKVGVNVSGDFTRLKKHLDVQGQGIFEVSHMYNLVRYAQDVPAAVNKKLVALAKQIEDVFGLPLYKGAVRSSHWSRPLTGEQIHYAAADAYAGLRLYHELDVLRQQMDPAPPRPALYEKQLPILLANGLPPPSPPRKPKRPKLATAESGSEATVISNEEEDTSASQETTAAEETVADDGDVAASASSIDMDDLEQPRAEPNSASAAGTDPRVADADEWCRAYRALRQEQRRPSGKLAALRAYVLWHQHALSVDETAALLKDPPLKSSTVRSYIVEAVAFDTGLPVDSSRLKEVAASVPRYILLNFKGLMRKLDQI